MREEWYKYILEVFVVVIGLLIAFSLNNWRESIKEKKVELESLKNLRSDLFQNLGEIQSIMDREQAKLGFTDSLLIFMMENEAWDRNFIFFCKIIKSTNVFNSPKSGYRFFENQGIDFRGNDTLRKAIIELYEQDFLNIHYRQEMLLREIETGYIPLLNKHFKIRVDTIDGRIEFIQAGFPVDYPSLRNNIEFQNRVKMLENIRRIRVYRLAPTIEKLQRILEVIDQQIENLE